MTGLRDAIGRLLSIGPRPTLQEAIDGDRIRINPALAAKDTHAEHRSVLPKGKQWLPHCGKQEQRRHLRRTCAAVYRLKDAASLRALARLRDAVKDDPDSLAAEFNLAGAALEASVGVGTTWAEAMDRLLDLYAERASVA